MSRQLAIRNLYNLARSIAATEQGADLTDIQTKSRLTYAAVAAFRKLHGKRPSQSVIDCVRFTFVWS